ncbi:MAG: enoyl-CoA hydratase/isomerase family protein [Xanthomonadales bacterium]|nr:enoyl-CoA hydratase/isomerase family protein [Xanthomonadales bacterium]
MSEHTEQHTEFTTLRLQIDGHAAEIELLGPGRGNAMGPAFWDELPAAVAQAEADPRTRTLLVTGQGEHFCFGLDLPATAALVGPLLENGARGRIDVITEAQRMQRGFDALAASRLPVIAAVQGWCIGAGVELCAAADLRLASADARFALREVKVGLVPDLGGIQRLPHLVGEGWARWLALTGDDINARQALAIGLVNQICDDHAALLSAARALAGRIAANPPLVVSAIKRVMAQRVAPGVAQGNLEAATMNGLLTQSEDFAEAVRAFMERRSPNFRGR